MLASTWPLVKPRCPAYEDVVAVILPLKQAEDGWVSGRRRMPS